MLCYTRIYILILTVLLYKMTLTNSVNGVGRIWFMEFNLKKCEHLTITNTRCLIIYSYFLGNSAITEVPHTKYLGVTIDQKLSWNEHTQRITSKANQVSSFCVATSISVLLMLNCYKMMARPVIEYLSTVWAPYTLTNINQLESIQWRAARFCCNDFSTYSNVTRMMSSLNMPTLEQRRNIAKLITMYKILIVY